MQLRYDERLTEQDEYRRMLFDCIPAARNAAAVVKWWEENRDAGRVTVPRERRSEAMHDRLLDRYTRFMMTGA